MIASGGIGTLDHFSEGVKKGSASALLAASVFHFGKFSITQVKKHLISNGINVRMDYLQKKVMTEKILLKLSKIIKTESRHREPVPILQNFLKKVKLKLLTKLVRKRLKLFPLFCQKEKKRY